MLRALLRWRSPPRHMQAPAVTVEAMEVAARMPVAANPRPRAGAMARTAAAVVDRTAVEVVDRTAVEVLPRSLAVAALPRSLAAVVTVMVAAVPADQRS